MTDRVPPEEPAKPQSRIPKKWLFRVGMSALVLGITFQFLPTDKIFATISETAPSVWIGSLAVYLFGHVLSAAKWRFLISGATRISFASAVRAHFAGLVANLCLPGAAGGDVVRAGLVIRGADDRAGVAIASLADRLLDMFALLVLAIAGAQLTASGSSGAGMTLLQIGLALGAVVLGAVFLMAVGPQLPLPGKVKSLVVKVVQSLRSFASEPVRPLVSFCVALLVQTTFVSVNVFLAEQHAIDIPRAAWFLGWPLAKLLAIAPVSVGGLGVREASLAALLSRFGADPARVVAVGFLWQSILWAGGLLGGLVLLVFSRLQQPPRVQVPADN